MNDQNERSVARVRESGCAAIELNTHKPGDVVGVDQQTGAVRLPYLGLHECVLREQCLGTRYVPLPLGRLPLGCCLPLPASRLLEGRSCRRRCRRRCRGNGRARGASGRLGVQERRERVVGGRGTDWLVLTREIERVSENRQNKQAPTSLVYTYIECLVKTERCSSDDARRRHGSPTTQVS